MAQRSMDNGRDDARGAQQRPMPGEAPSGRGADVAPPGSRERAEGHVTGWTPDKEPESMALRQGPFHRAATERLYQPRGGRNAGDVGPGGFHGPRGMTDRDDGRRLGPSSRGDARRFPPGPSFRAREEDSLRWDDSARTWREDSSERDRSERARRGEPDMRGETLSAEYRAMGRGEPYRDERSPRRGERLSSDVDEHYDPVLGLDSVSPGVPGRGAGPGTLSHYHHEADRGQGGERARGRRWAREPLTAREIMTRGVKTVRRDSPLREVAQLMRDEDCGVVPIVDEGGILVGLVTDRDLVIRAFTGGRSPDALRAGDVMTDDVQAVTPDEDIHGIIELMGRRQVRRVPVVDRDDRLLGIISMGDIANRADYDEELQEALDRVSARRSFWHRLG